MWLLFTACSPYGSGPPARSGTYTCAAGVHFTVDAAGVWDNGDNMGCGTAVDGGRITLSCHGFPRSAVWKQNPDGSVDTDVVDRLYGEGGCGAGVVDHCTWTP